MSKIVFSKTGLSDLTLERGRTYPLAYEISIDQENYLTESMNPKVVDYGGRLKLISLRFEGLSKDNYDGTVNGLKTWFESTTINWMQNSFTMYDERGASHTVRLWSSKFEVSETAAGRFNINLVLLKE